MSDEESGHLATRVAVLTTLRQVRVRRSEALRLVLVLYLRDPSSEMYGKQILDSTGLAPASVYPLLRKLVEAGILSVRTVGTDRSARRCYRLTPGGFTAAAVLVDPASVVERTERPVGVSVV